MKIIVAVLLFTLYALSGNAQDAVRVKSFVQTTDHIPGVDRKNDLNNVPCALVKIYVVDEIDRIEGNKIGDIVKKGNVEKWVYMCKGSRNIRIHFRNHLPVRVMFQDYQINGLESNRIYELFIEMSDMTVPKGTGTAIASTGDKQQTPANTQPKKDNRQEQPRYTVTPSTKDNHVAVTQSPKEDRYGYSEPVVSQPRQTVTPPRPLNKSFKVNYAGVTFKCKAKKGYVTITGFDTGAASVTIPGMVEYHGEYYPVREIDTFINGNNYAATKLVIEEGLERIEKFAFIEFRKLVDVTIPGTIKEIGRKAFRDNDGMHFNAPSNISEHDLKAGRAILVR